MKSRRITEHAVKSIESKGFVFTRTMMDKSEEIARLINDASLNATSAITRTLGQMQEGAQGVTEAAKSTISRTLEELHRATKGAIEELKQTAAATVAEMMETHTMLRSDSTALFERLREANILLQEVLSGAQENMNSIEHTMASRVSEFVAAMSDLSSKSGATTAKVEQHLGTFNNVTASVLHDLGDLCRAIHLARTLACRSGRAAGTRAIAAPRKRSRRGTSSIEALVAHARHANRRFRAAVAALLRPARRVARYGDRAGTRDRRDHRRDQQRKRAIDRAAIRARPHNLGRGAQAHQRSAQFDLQRGRRRRAGDVHAVRQRFTEIMQGMKQMAAEMQQELETTRTELRRGVLELPQETAESTAQMRRVIVDQIEALAELNRIVARHGRSLDAAEPMRREAEPLYAAGGGRGGQARPMRPISAAVAAAQTWTRDITGAPARRRPTPPNAQSGSGRQG